MTVYLASPRTQQQAEHAEGFPVLLSFATWSPWIDRYQASFGRLLIDSGAFSELNSGVKVNIDEYLEWAERWNGHADAVAGLDDISGDWRRSLKNYEAGGFPTYHDSDPASLLDELIPIARERGGWLGIGLKPPREGKMQWVKDTLRRIPEGIHVHGWACRLYSRFRRFDSFDSTNWWREAQALRSRHGLHWLTFGECLDIQIKRIKRSPRMLLEETDERQLDFFDPHTAPEVVVQGVLDGFRGDFEREQ